MAHCIMPVAMQQLVRRVRSLCSCCAFCSKVCRVQYRQMAFAVAFMRRQWRQLTSTCYKAAVTIS